MSWWPTGKGDDVIGDEAADALGAVIPLHTPVDPSVVVATVEAVLRESDLDLVGDGGPGLTLETRPPAKRAADNGRLREEIAQALRRVTAVYEDRWDRRPRSTEIASLLAFILRGHPSGTGITLEDVIARAR